MPKQMKFYLNLIFLFYGTFSFSQHVILNEIMSSNYQVIADEDGDYVDWIELYNNSNIPINLEHFKLTDDPSVIDKWSFPSIIINPHEFLLVFASGKNRITLNQLHTNFKIDSDGEPLILSSPNHNIIDSYSPISLGQNKSYGRLNDGTPNIGFLSIATPNQSNNSAEFITEIHFSTPSGFYSTPFELILDCQDSIYYTLDGSIPTLNSNLYTSSIHVSSNSPNKFSLITTSPLVYLPDEWPNSEFGFQLPQENLNKGMILRTVSYKNGIATSKIYNHTYFTTPNKYTLPVLSLITDSLNLFDQDTGIYVPGNLNANWTGNYNQRGITWERSGNLDYFGHNGNLKFSKPIGFRISGQSTRSKPQKSIRIYFRGEYESTKVKYPFFPKRNYSEFKRIILRSSFTYWWGKNTLFQDDFLQTVVSQNNIDLDFQMSQASVLFINGEYWGLHNIRERQDKYYLAAIHAINPDSIDILAGNLSVIEGSSNEFTELIDFVESHDLSEVGNYEFVNSKIDINNYINYCIIEMYFNNTDWPKNNLKLWKSKKTDSKWRFLLYDLDATLSNYKTNPFDSFSDSLNAQCNLFNSLLTNKTFKAKFINQFIYHLQTTFNPKVNIQLIDEFESIYDPEIKEHIKRWSNPNSYAKWKENCESMKTFISNRPCYMKDILINKFHLNDMDEFDCYYRLNQKNEPVLIYPNPNNGNFTLLIKEQKENNPGNIIIYDQLGKKVYTQTILNNALQVNLNNLSNGIYFVKIEYGGELHTEKIIISKQ